ncbi:MAG: polyprenyl synthetase family protein [Dehalococcoidia bacterium]|nr:polyprenyl synthetase family protein [Dehalococcoidia bacterium]
MRIETIFEPVKNEMPLVMETLGSVADVDYPQLADIARHVMSGLGKGIRPALTLLSGKFNQYNLDRLVPMAAATELLHVASLVHDDTIDKSPLRRGLPTLYNIWGDSAATIAGDYLFAKSAELAAVPGNLRAVRLFAQTLMALAKGELEENLSVYDWQQSREDYFRRITGKTAALFAMAAESGAILSDSPEEHVQSLKSYGLNLGLAFQVIDDLLDFTGDEAVMGKPVGNDLLQGILTLPALLYLEQRPDDNPVKRGFENKGKGKELRHAITQIQQSPFIAESYSVAKDLVQRAKQSINPLPDSPAKSSLLSLADYVLERDK